ncbi:MAG: AEC family transporter [Rhodospirillum sp.]|nr:AEC family transporter [Rhodospirillum sp.]MCF8491247.1 AEC family transporter [Rhodospirillum sp.]MCF8500777.1 AEC family transporter [Rhodospirillum sp.]
MIETLRIVFPIFTVIGIGFLFGRRKMIGEGGVQGIVNFVFFLAIPCLLFRTLSQSHMGESFDLHLVGAYYGGGLVLFGLTWMISRHLFRNERDTSGLAAMAGTFSNTVLVTLPLVQRAYGEAGLVPLMILIMLHSGIYFTVTTLAIGFSQGVKGAGLGKTLWEVARSVLLNPVVLACLMGMLWSVGGLTMPAVVDDTLAFIGRAASPVALLAVGVTLSSQKLGGDLREILVVTALKLVGLPFVVWLAATQVFHLRPDWVSVAVITAASPAGANVYVFANRYGLYIQRATGVVMLSTVLSLGTLITLFAILPKP